MAKKDEENYNLVTTNKTFAYKRPFGHLSFTLNIDDKRELTDFLSCLTAAKADVEEALEEMKN